MSADDQCEERVSEPPGYWHWHRCSRTAVVTVTADEMPPKRVCKQHAKVHVRRGWTEKIGAGRDDD